MEEVKIYKCFIASPGDTQIEREICDRVFSDINETQGKQCGFRIESKKWEKDARPSFGEDAQDVINKQLLNDFHLFIGIMFTRFGSPTKNAGSGTEEEFQIAYEKKDDIEIMFYFNIEKTSPASIDPSQLIKVNDFKQKVSDKGGLFSDYTGATDFERKLKKHLYTYFSEIYEETTNNYQKNEADTIADVLNNRLNDSLSTFSNQPDIWVDPLILEPKKSADPHSVEDQKEIKINDLVQRPYSLIIESPPQFGLTCLSHYLIIQAWKNNSVWIYLDMNKINIQIDLEKTINQELKKLNLVTRTIDCIILDSWKPSLTGAMKVLRGICNGYPNTPLMVMNTIGDFKPSSDHDMKINRSFAELTLSALSRNSIRKVVSDYNIKKNIGDENTVLDKVVKDIEVLNIHRTPLNCITLLKISEKHFDESPVNRTKMIEMFLFVLFDLVELPTYKTKPDVKDCEHVLGFFCESLIKRKVYDFSKEEFLKLLNKFCEDNLLDLEITVVFDVLLDNRIIVGWDGRYKFKATYWVFYFAANQMHVDKQFYDYVISNEVYTNFPEIIEFYTGIDRNSSDMIKVLTDDLSKQCSIVEEKTGMTTEFNPLEAMQWNPSEEHIEEAKQLINTEVTQSKLPDSLKDDYADKGYNYDKPYNQDVSDILEKYTFLVLKQKISACSRALRNSDYIKPSEKIVLLKEITRGWSLFSQILFVLAPTMAKNNYASFDGLGFFLCGFGDVDIDVKIKNIILCNPSFVVKLFRDDLFSPKSAPLLYGAIKSETNALVKHELMLLLIFGRPKDWAKYVKNYISHLPKNSPYLLDALNLLSNRYKYDFASQKEITDMGALLKMCYAKHKFNGTNLIDQMKKISNKVIPERNDDLS